MYGYGSQNPQDDTALLAQHAANMEAILGQMGLNPQDVRMNSDAGYAYTFRRGSAVIEIYIASQEGTGYLQVLSPIMHIPESGLVPLYRHLLELNLQLTNAALGIYNDVVYVFSERPLDSLDANEANDIVSKVALYADELDDRLVSQFGGRLFNQA